MRAQIRCLTAVAIVFGFLFPWAAIAIGQEVVTIPGEAASGARIDYERALPAPMPSVASGPAVIEGSGRSYAGPWQGNTFGYAGSGSKGPASITPVPGPCDSTYCRR